jgi:nucleotide-binding universal stress UspA family protein
MDTSIGTPVTVLLASDDSDAARNAEAWVTRLRWSRPCVVDVLCVAREGLTRLGWGMQTYRTAVREAVEQLRLGEVLAAEGVANEVGERLQAHGLTVRVWARQGDPAEEIRAAIATDQPDLLVLGARGRSRLAQLLLGSVSSQFIDEAGEPVLIARRPPEGGGPLPGHLLILVDRSLAAESAIDWVMAAGWARGATVTLLGLGGLARGVEPSEPELAEEVSALMRDDVVTALDRLSERLRDQAVAVTTEIELGHPLEGALRAAERLAPDLIVAARPPRGRGQDPFVEKVARYASTSVLIVPQH